MGLRLSHHITLTLRRPPLLNQGTATLGPEAYAHVEGGRCQQCAFLPTRLATLSRTPTSICGQHICKQINFLNLQYFAR